MQVKLDLRLTSAKSGKSRNASDKASGPDFAIGPIPEALPSSGVASESDTTVLNPQRFLARRFPRENLPPTNHRFQWPQRI
jgi:hypothetical protein